VEWSVDEASSQKGAFTIVSCTSYVRESEAIDAVLGTYFCSSLAILSKIFKLVQERFPDLQVCTADFWLQEIGLPLVPRSASEGSNAN
jgi:hypothetical protein